MEEIFKQVTSVVAQVMEGMAVLLIAIGGVGTAYGSLWPLLHGKFSPQQQRVAWLNFARWLLLGLEFTLAADIVRTAITPTWDAIGQLASIAVIRTFLSYFLERDLEKASGDLDLKKKMEGEL